MKIMVYEVRPDEQADLEQQAALHGVELADVQFGDDVCVVGIGPVGLMSVAGAALHGAAQLFAVGSRPVCAEAARRYGATEILNYREGDIVAQVMDRIEKRMNYYR